MKFSQCHDTKLLYIKNIPGKTFAVILETLKLQKFSPADLSMFTVFCQVSKMQVKYHPAAKKYFMIQPRVHNREESVQLQYSPSKMSPLSIFVYVSALTYIIKMLTIPISTPLSYQTARAGSYGYTKQKSALIDRSIADRLII